MDVDTLMSLIPSLIRDCISIIESYIDKFRFKLAHKHILDECVKDILLLDSKIVYLTENNILKIINTDGEILSSRLLDNNCIRPILLPCNKDSFVVLYRSVGGGDNIKYVDNNCKENTIIVSDNFILADTNLINIKRNKLVIKCYNNGVDKEIIFRENISLYTNIKRNKIALYFEYSSNICIISIKDNKYTYIKTDYRITNMIANKDILICYSYDFANIYYLNNKENIKIVRINNLDINILDIVNNKLILVTDKSIFILNSDLTINKSINYINPVRLQSILDDNTMVALSNSLILDEKEISLGNKDIFTTLGNKLLICRDKRILELYS